jgi:ribonuclease III
MTAYNDSSKLSYQQFLSYVYWGIAGNINQHNRNLPKTGELVMGRNLEKHEDLPPHEIARRIGLNFSDSSILARALTHRSFLNEHPEALEDNERLEFLGDAVLDFLVGAWLYNHFPEMPEGYLTRLRSALVRTDQLARFAQEIDLGDFMRLGRGEDESGGRERPGLLCATFEALVGALYLDQGFEAVEAFIGPMLEPAARQILSGHKDKDPKSMLQEWAQSQGLGTPFYHTVADRGPDHAKVFEVEVLINNEKYGQGVGNSKQVAAKAAARAALTALGLD